MWLLSLSDLLIMNPIPIISSSWFMVLNGYNYLHLLTASIISVCLWVWLLCSLHYSLIFFICFVWVISFVCSSGCKAAGKHLIKSLQSLMFRWKKIVFSNVPLISFVTSSPQKMRRSISCAHSDKLELFKGTFEVSYGHEFL